MLAKLIFRPEPPYTSNPCILNFLKLVGAVFKIQHIYEINGYCISKIYVNENGVMHQKGGKTPNFILCKIIHR